MNRSAKIAISLPEDTLEAVEKQRKISGESRSSFFNRAVENLLKQEQEAKLIESYVEGYRAIPESAGEIDAIHRSGVSMLAEETW